MDNPECDSCNQPMNLVKRLNNGQNKSGLKYRRRRYHCPICDIYHTMYCDGSGDDAHVAEAIKDSDKIEQDLLINEFP